MTTTVKNTAPARYEMHRATAIEMLARMLKNLQADRQAATVNWSHAADMGSYVERLQHIHDQMFHEGEHAPERNTP